MAWTFSRRAQRIFTAFLILGLSLGLIFSWQTGSSLCAPCPRAAAAPAGLPFEAVAFPSASGSIIHGWLVVPPTNHGVVVLQHGVRASRAAMVDRARFLSAAGYAVLLFDFQAHGESPGKQITYGFLESRDSQAAVAYVRQRLPGQPVGVIGVSLGGAAALLAQPPLDAQALVLESVFSDIVSATKDRLEWVWGRPARLLSPLLTCQLYLRIGISPDKLRPVDHAAEIKTPKLFLHGTLDPRTRIAEAEKMFAHAAGPKRFVPVEGADHGDLHHFLGARYEKLVLEFLTEHLK